MKNRVLITGGAGFIGSHTADLLLEKGYVVRLMDNLSRFNDGRWPKYLNGSFEKFKGDVRNKKDWVKALKGVDYVIHLAALMDFHLEFSKFFEVNTVGTANLYEVIVLNNYPIKKIIIASSQFVYGYGIWKCDNHGLMRLEERKTEYLLKGIWDPTCPKCNTKLKYRKNKESDANPPNQYAISKYSQELIALKLGKIHNIPSSVLRYSIVHGSRQSISNLYSGALRVFVLQLMQNKRILLFEDGQTKRDFISVKDVAIANILAMESDKTNFDVYNVGGEMAYTISELSRIIAKVLGKNIVAEYGSYRVGDMRHAISDISKLKKLGWSPKGSEEESVKDFITWVKQHKVINNTVDKAFNKMKKEGTLLKT